MKRLSLLSAGFSLVELLVAIAILAVLSAMAMGTYVSAQKSARDARRQGDIKNMQTALEQHFTQNTSSYTNGCTGIGTYLAGNIPVDPLGGESYGCTILNGGAGYCLSSDLEKDNGNCNVSGTACTYTSGQDGGFHCATQLQ